MFPYPRKRSHPEGWLNGYCEGDKGGRGYHEKELQILGMQAPQPLPKTILSLERDVVIQIP